MPIVMGSWSRTSTVSRLGCPWSGQTSEPPSPTPTGAGGRCCIGLESGRWSRSTRSGCGSFESPEVVARHAEVDHLPSREYVEMADKQAAKMANETGLTWLGLTTRASRPTSLSAVPNRLQCRPPRPVRIRVAVEDGPLVAVRSGRHFRSPRDIRRQRARNQVRPASEDPRRSPGTRARLMTGWQSGSSG